MRRILAVLLAGTLLAGAAGSAGAAPAAEPAPVPTITPPLITDVVARDGAVDVDFIGGRGGPRGFVVTATPGGGSLTVPSDARTARLTG
ncbi:hypothetical protein GCM10009759_13420 [Kitasatospora saccharophila]|uniref:Uncharacterized protein n=1 Tax=Kitasatospora saccharophila TaxID=407973 RepID=A0ABN2WER0_9ACTN